MFYIFFLYLTFLISLPLTQQHSFESTSEEEKDKILTKWLGVEIDGAYFFDWSTQEVEQATENNKVEQEQEEDAVGVAWTSESKSSKRFINDPPDDCFPVQKRRGSSTDYFMRMLQRQCWDEVLPVSGECSAHSSAERVNTPAGCYHNLLHVAAFLLVAKLLYIL
uniref:Uncharacterized protein n=1 Tax=Bactrocera latifrons TaxID=174628 RepID=A0A0K8W5B9_BACLA